MKTRPLTRAPLRQQPALWHLSSGQQELLKWLAILSMILDHANRTLWPFEAAWLAVGRLAFPLFAFLIAYNTVVRGVPAKRYLLPLLIGGVISQPAYVYAFGYGWWSLNIFFTLLLGVMVRPLVAKLRSYLPSAYAVVSWLLVILIVALAAQFVDYHVPGVLLIAVLQSALIRPRALQIVLAGVVLLAANAFRWYSLVPLVLAPLVFLLIRVPVPALPRSRWLFYVIYPAHLILLGVLGRTIGVL